MLVRGKLPGAGKNNQEIGVELYDTNRYFTVTGDRWHDCADTITDDNDIIDFVYKLASKKMKNNETQIDRIFRTSGLMHEKWDEPHHAGGITYGAKTISNACTATKSVYKSTRKTQK